MSNKRPKISVVLPVYNGARFVNRAIQSVSAQTYCDFEFIIVNDGSTDATQYILERWAATDDRIRILSRSNTGIVGAENDGIALAAGEYIARIDADDWCDPTRFERQVARMDADRDLVALGSAANIVDEHGADLGVFHVPLTHEEIEANHLKGLSSIHHPAVLMRTNAVRAVGCYREESRPADDFDLWMRLAEVGRLANLSEHLITKRQTVDGIVGSNLGRQMGDAIERILRDTWQRRGLPGKPVLPKRSVLCRGDLYRQWAWMALRSRNKWTARKYAFRSAIRQPFHPIAWRTLACAIRGR